jgi:hypothetical protein
LVEGGEGFGADAVQDRVRVGRGAQESVLHGAWFREEEEPVTIDVVCDAAAAGAGALFDRRQEPVPDGAIEFAFSGVEFLGFEGFDQRNELGLVVGAFEIASHPVESIRNAAGDLARWEGCARVSAYDDWKRFILEVFVEDPRVFAGPRENVVLLAGVGVYAGEGAWKNVEIFSGTDGKDHMVLGVFGSAAFVEDESRSALLFGLSYEKVRLAAHIGEEHVLTGGRGWAGGGGGMEGFDPEEFDVFKDMLPLIEVAEPERGGARENWGFAEVKSDDLLAVGEKGGVVGQWAADRIHKGRRTFAEAVDQPRNATVWAPAKNKGIELVVGLSVSDDVHAFETTDGFQIDTIVEDEEVAAFDYWNAHAASEETLFRGGSGSGSGGEEDHGGFA